MWRIARRNEKNRAARMTFIPNWMERKYIIVQCTDWLQNGEQNDWVYNLQTYHWYVGKCREGAREGVFEWYQHETENIHTHALTHTYNVQSTETKCLMEKPKKNFAHSKAFGQHMLNAQCSIIHMVLATTWWSTFCHSFVVDSCSNDSFTTYAGVRKRKRERNSTIDWNVHIWRCVGGFWACVPKMK